MSERSASGTVNVSVSISPASNAPNEVTPENGVTVNKGRP